MVKEILAEVTAENLTLSFMHGGRQSSGVRSEFALQPVACATIRSIFNRHVEGWLTFLRHIGICNLGLTFPLFSYRTCLPFLSRVSMAPVLNSRLLNSRLLVLIPNMAYNY